MQLLLRKKIYFDGLSKKKSIHERHCRHIKGYKISAATEIVFKLSLLSTYIIFTATYFHNTISSFPIRNSLDFALCLQVSYHFPLPLCKYSQHEYFAYSPKHWFCNITFKNPEQESVSSYYFLFIFTRRKVTVKYR